MNIGMAKNIAIVLLVTITAFSIFKYSASIKEKYDLSEMLNLAKEQITALEKEKQGLLGTLQKERELEQQLTQKNSGLRDNLKAAKNRLARLFRQAAEAEKEIDKLDSQFSLIKAENQALVEKEEKWKLVAQENESLKVKLSSVAELKKAIRDLKKQAGKARVENQQKKMPLSEKIVEGNYGYVIKDGQYNYPAKVKIEVTPAPIKE